MSEILAGEASRVPGPYDGRITVLVDYTVWCANCGDWDDIPPPVRGLREAAAKAREGGWKLTRARGWLCPKCWAGRPGGEMP